MPRHYSAEHRRQACERVIPGEAVNDLGDELDTRWGPCSKRNMKGLWSRRGIERARASSDPIGETMRARLRVRPTQLVMLAPDPPPQSTNTPVVIAATMPSTARAASCL